MSPTMTPFLVVFDVSCTFKTWLARQYASSLFNCCSRLLCIISAKVIFWFLSSGLANRDYNSFESWSADYTSLGSFFTLDLKEGFTSLIDCRVGHRFLLRVGLPLVDGIAFGDWLLDYVQDVLFLAGQRLWVVPVEVDVFVASDCILAWLLLWRLYRRNFRRLLLLSRSREHPCKHLLLLGHFVRSFRLL